MNNKLNGWNNNLTPFDGVGGKPGYHEKIPIMTPEQKKAKEIVEKYRKIILRKIVLEVDVYIKNPDTRSFNKEVGLIVAAKACAIEEVKAIINNQMSLSLFYEKMEIVDNVKMLQQLLTEIEKL